MIIGICDDMPEYISQIRKKCECYFEKKCMEYDFVEFLSGEEVLEYKKNIDILFLDIEMNKGISGIETKDKLLKHDNVWKIVFVTNYDEKFKFTYGLKTLGYISKPVEYSDLEKWLNIAADELNESKILMFKEQKNIRKIMTTSIIYMEGDRNNTYIYTECERILASGNMKHWEEQTIHTSLTRIHKSYIVNMEHISTIRPDYVKVQNYSVEIPIGRTYRKAFKKLYIRYMDKKINNRI